MAENFAKRELTERGQRDIEGSHLQIFARWPRRGVTATDAHQPSNAVCNLQLYDKVSTTPASAILIL